MIVDKVARREIAQAEKSRVTITNMGYKDNSPPLISIIGPKNSGKSTLIRSIINHHWKKSKKVDGPVTIKTGNRRYTFYECTNELDVMIDTIKVSDMIIYTINLQVGLEMETLESINMMNSHGVPKLCFVLTNYDQRQSNKAMNDIEKRLEKEFSFPIKFFCFKQQEDSTYDNIKKLIRHLETMKYRPIEWKCVHPYIVVDKVTDGVAFGYLRGGPIGDNFNAHIPGVGDRNIKNIVAIQDPCSLSQKGNAIYNPLNHNTEVGEEQASESADSLFLEEAKIKLFDGNNSDSREEELSEASEPSISDIKEEEKPIDKISIEKDDSALGVIAEPLGLQELKEKLRARFKTVASTESDLIEKFNDEYKKKQEKDTNILQTMKKRELEKEKELEEICSLLIPGAYLKFDLENVEFNPKNILLIGGYLPLEGNNVLLKGKVLKNKWQKFDLKTNAPYFFSIGWSRFQSIPTFCKDDKMVKYCKEFSELVFYSTMVPQGTGFFLYSYDAEYRILGAGQILDTSGNYSIKKKLKLIGHPKTITGRNAIIHSMFSSSREANKFLNAKLNTVSKLRGLLKSAIGKDGCVRAMFEGTILMSETVFLKCFVSIEPYTYIQHTGANVQYVRHLKDIKAGLEDESNSTEDEESSIDENIEPYFDERKRKKEKLENIELRKLKRQLPFSKREIREVKETIELPTPPENRKALQSRLALEEKRKLFEREAEEASKQRHAEKVKKLQIKMQEKAEYKKKSAIKSNLEKKKHKKRSK
ncbi:Glycoside hydrolase 2 Mannanase beta-galactosidase [Glugoides intestinalis]